MADTFSEVSIGSAANFRGQINNNFDLARTMLVYTGNSEDDASSVLNKGGIWLVTDSTNTTAE